MPFDEDASGGPFWPPMSELTPLTEEEKRMSDVGYRVTGYVGIVIACVLFFSMIVGAL